MIFEFTNTQFIFSCPPNGFSSCFSCSHCLSLSPCLPPNCRFQSWGGVGGHPLWVHDVHWWGCWHSLPQQDPGRHPRGPHPHHHEGQPRHRTLRLQSLHPQEDWHLIWGRIPSSSNVKKKKKERKILFGWEKKEEERMTRYYQVH